jgi:hypothetical protein
MLPAKLGEAALIPNENLREIESILIITDKIEWLTVLNRFQSAYRSWDNCNESDKAAFRYHSSLFNLHAASNGSISQTSDMHQPVSSSFVFF